MSLTLVKYAITPHCVLKPSALPYLLCLSSAGQQQQDIFSEERNHAQLPTGFPLGQRSSFDFSFVFGFDKSSCFRARCAVIMLFA